MGLRFRKSFKLAPGVRMNVGLGGTSWSIGPRGASVSLGKRGVYFNSGIPGTGLSTRAKLSGGGGSRRAASSEPKLVNVSVSVEVGDTGEITFKDQHGQPVNDYLIAEAKKQKGDVIMNLIQSKCDKINAQVQALGEIHHYTPSPQDNPQYMPISFDEPAPRRPMERKPNFIQKLFKGMRAKIAAENSRNEAVYQTALREWEDSRNNHHANETARKDMIERVSRGDVAVMEAWLEQVLNDIEWPKETDLSFEFIDFGKRLVIDVDLPEIEEMPNKTASVPQRGLRLSVKEMSATAIQKLYMMHVHAVGFRIIGEAFSALPTVDEILLSGYSQRVNRTTGHEGDEYLYSVRILRSEWAKLNFARLADLDLVEVFTQFTLKRNMTKTGVFKAVEPLLA